MTTGTKTSLKKRSRALQTITLIPCRARAGWLSRQFLFFYLFTIFFFAVLVNVAVVDAYAP